MLIVLGCAVLAVALYALAVYGTAGPAAGGAVAGTLAVALTVLASGGTPRDAAGIGGLAAGGSAMVWAMGRSRRRRRAGRSALAAYRAASAAIPRLAATAERDRLAAELHDVAAHRLTGIVVGSAAALRLADPDLTAEAVAHAAGAGRQAVSELDRLAALDQRGETPTLGDIDTLLDGHPGVTCQRTVATAPPELASVAFRVVREALTNAMRYATGAAVHVRVETVPGRPDTPKPPMAPADPCRPDTPGPRAQPPATPADPGLLVVTVTDGGGPATPGLGAGTGLAALRQAVTAVGGTLLAGPVPLDGPAPSVPAIHGPARGVETARTPPPLPSPATGGWMVQACLPLTPDAPAVLTPGRPRPFPRLRYGEARPHRHGRTAGWRGTAALDWALVVLAVALPGGTGLLSTEVPAPFAAPASGGLLLTLLVLHALPLRWRRRMPRLSLAAAQGVLLVWLGCDAAGWTGPGSAQLVLLCWWVELTLVHTVGAYGTRGWPAPVAVAALGAFPLVDGLTGPPVAVWATLTAAFAVPTVSAWAVGLLVGGRRRRLRAAAALDRDRLDRDATAAARAERGRIAAGLRRTARSHAEAVVRAADERRLDLVLAEAKAGLAALRELLDELRGDPAGDDPPPVIAAISALAARRHAVARYTGTRRPLPAAVEVAAYRIADALVTDGATVTVAYLPGGLTLSGAAEARKVRAMADAAGGTVTETEDGVRVWLPEVFPA
ncbi:histidine kinase [Streptosporangium roseum]|uniref:ATP-binding protein n=1 Tax=Streptosporangium roseum TaxID=2001 RepID=UPI0004CD341C|nr:histidine kinase [Streptosporangium roseum]